MKFARTTPQAKSGAYPYVLPDPIMHGAVFASLVPANTPTLVFQPSLIDPTVCVWLQRVSLQVVPGATPGQALLYHGPNSGTSIDPLAVIYGAANGPSSPVVMEYGPSGMSLQSAVSTPTNVYVTCNASMAVYVQLVYIYALEPY